MAVNVERFRNDLDRLVREGIELENAMSYEPSREECLQLINKAFNNDKTKVDEFIAK
jgi:hypothetical protein